MAKASKKIARTVSEVREFARSNPVVAALLRQLLTAVIHGISPEDKARLVAAHAELDTDGDGAPDAVDAAPTDPAVK